MAQPLEHPRPVWRRKVSRFIDVVLWLAVAGMIFFAFMPRDSGPQLGVKAAVLEMPVLGTENRKFIPDKLDRPLLIKAFASWCGACRRSNGLLTELEDARKKGILDVVAVSVEEDAEDALSAKKNWQIANVVSTSVTANA